VSSVVQPVVESLAATTGETAHLSLLAGNMLVPICVVQSQRANRVSLSPSETLPLHATASGIAFMAFSPDGFAAKALRGKLKAYTSHTLTSRDGILRQVDAARRIGYATAYQTLEDDVSGVAAPIFGQGGTANGAIAVATPSNRLTRELKALVIQAVMEAASDASHRLGVEPPADFVKLCLRAAA
jgi:DNA-binding IclR family transcriptional regulator